MSGLSYRAVRKFFRSKRAAAISEFQTKSVVTIFELLVVGFDLRSLLSCQDTMHT